MVQPPRRNVPAWRLTELAIACAAPRRAALQALLAADAAPDKFSPAGDPRAVWDWYSVSKW